MNWSDFYNSIKDELKELSELQTTALLHRLIGWFSDNKEFQEKAIDYIKEAKEEYKDFNL